MDKGKLLNVIIRIAQTINESCETDKEIEQVRDGLEKYIDFSKPISRT